MTDTKIENDEARSKRRAAELAALVAEHRATATKAHADHPTPRKKFARMSGDERRRWNTKRALIAASSKKYHLAVCAACARHRAEDAAARAAVVTARADKETAR